MYQIVLHRRAVKQLENLPKNDREKILNKIKELVENPTNQNLNIRPYHNTKRSWRIRAGDLRAIYTFDTKKRIIFVEHLGHRGNVYQK